MEDSLNPVLKDTHAILNHVHSLVSEFQNVSINVYFSRSFYLSDQDVVTDESSRPTCSSAEKG